MSEKQEVEKDRYTFGYRCFYCGAKLEGVPYPPDFPITIREGKGERLACENCRRGFTDQKSILRLWVDLLAEEFEIPEQSSSRLYGHLEVFQKEILAESQQQDRNPVCYFCGGNLGPALAHTMYMGKYICSSCAMYKKELEIELRKFRGDNSGTETDRLKEKIDTQKEVIELLREALKLTKSVAKDLLKIISN